MASERSAAAKEKSKVESVCMDFTNLNKAYPKDPYSILWIDLLVDSIASHELLSFMDAYSWYN